MSFLRAHWRAVLVAAAILGALGFGFFSGRRTAPAKIVTKTETVEKVVTRDVVKVVEVKAKDTKRHTTTHVVVTERPDGTKTRDVTRETDTGIKEDMRTAVRDDHNETRNTEHYQIRVETAQKDWKVGVWGGLELRKPATGSIDVTWLVGPHGEYRIPRTPLWAGLTAGVGLSSTGAVKSGFVGLTLSFEF